MLESSNVVCGTLASFYWWERWYQAFLMPHGNESKASKAKGWWTKAEEESIFTQLSSLYFFTMSNPISNQSLHSSHLWGLEPAAHGQNGRSNHLPADCCHGCSCRCARNKSRGGWKQGTPGIQILGHVYFEHRVLLSQGKHLRLFFLECKEHVHQAYKLGLAATALLALSHVIANVLGGCPCVCSGDGFRRSSPNKLMAAATLLLSWYLSKTTHLTLESWKNLHESHVHQIGQDCGHRWIDDVDYRSNI